MGVKDFVCSRSEPARSILTELLEWADSRGCHPEHKTIYVSFSKGDVVAAAYPHPSGVEVALALEDDVTDRRLMDASHLTWRTLPVLVNIRTAEEVADVLDLLELAAERVEAASHSVCLPNERFKGRRRRND